MIRDAKAALALLVEKRVLTLSALVSAIAGAPISGTWWAHPKGKLMFSIASELEDHRDVLACKLAGRATFVHRALWPALLRVVTDAAWRRERSRDLPAACTRLVRRVRSAPLRIDKKTLSPRERAALEKSCIMHISSEHTESGAHATVLRSWKSWARDSSGRAMLDAKKLDLEKARAALAACGVSL